MVENQLRFTRESRRDWEKLRGVRAVRVVGGRGAVGGVGCEPHEQRWELWERWERWDSSRLTYSAIADNPEGGLAGKGRLKVGGLRIKNNFY